MQLPHMLLLALGLTASTVIAQNAQNFVDLPVKTIDSHPPQTEEQLASVYSAGTS